MHDSFENTLSQMELIYPRVEISRKHIHVERIVVVDWKIIYGDNPYSYIPFSFSFDFYDATMLVLLILFILLSSYVPFIM